MSEERSFLSPAMRERLGRPRTLLGIALVVLVVVALLTPEPVSQGRTGDARLSTHLTGSQGARLFLELADRLGWRVARRATPEPPADAGAGVIHAVLAPTQPLSAIETHRLLRQVREGAALLYVLPQSRSILADSLHIRRSEGGELELPDDLLDATAECPEGRGGAVPLWPDWKVRLYTLRFTRPAPEPLQLFAESRIRGARLPSVVGFPLGRGRVVVASDPDLLRNDVLRVCEFGADLIAVRLLEYLSARSDSGALAGAGAAASGSPSSSTARRTLVLFDEYHQGYGAHPGTMRGILLYLTRVPSGHLLLQLLFAAVVWLLAVGPRMLEPVDARHVERRSPLEHVSALASAYSQVGATRTVASRLLQGVRRRVPHAVRSATLSDHAFLDWVQQVAPARGADVALVRRALEGSHPRNQLPALGDALRRVESSLVSLHR